MAILIVPSTNYPTIQLALDAVNSGDTVQILTGIYSENLSLVGTDNITITGEGESVLIDGSTIGGIAFNMKTNGTTVSELTFTNFTNGVLVLGNNNILNSVISINNTYEGMMIVGDYNQVIGGEVIQNKAVGLVTWGNYNLFVANRIKYNPIGLVVPNNSFMGNIIASNIFIDNVDFSIRISSPEADENIIYNNTINGSNYGILVDSGRAAIMSNIITNSMIIAIELNADNALVVDNNLVNNPLGMMLQTNESLITKNTIETGQYTGLTITGDNNMIVQNVVYGYRDIGMLINGDNNSVCNNSLVNDCTKLIDNGMNNCFNCKCEYNKSCAGEMKMEQAKNNKDYIGMLDMFKMPNKQFVKKSQTASK